MRQVGRDEVEPERKLLGPQRPRAPGTRREMGQVVLTKNSPASLWGGLISGGQRKRKLVLEKA